MLKRFVARVLDWLIAIAVVCLLLWFLITQPIVPLPLASGLPDVNQSNLKNHVTNLLHINRSKAVVKETLATDRYIFDYFSRLGKPAMQGYSTMGGRHNNVRLRVGPKTEERVVIGVQYLPPSGPERQFWNPSGIAALLETARVFALSEKELPIEVEFVAFASAGVAANGTLEMGSFHHAQLLREANVPIKLMIALSSVGYFTDQQQSQRYPFSFMRMLYPDTGHFIGLSSRLQDFSTIRTIKRGFSKVDGLAVESFSAPETFPLVAGSDHVNYWQNDYAAVQVSDMIELRHPRENKRSIDVTDLDFAKMSKVVQALAQVVRDLEEGDEEEVAQPSLFDRTIKSVTGVFK